jgi:hypothetical protein
MAKKFVFVNHTAHGWVVLLHRERQQEEHEEMGLCSFCVNDLRLRSEQEENYDNLSCLQMEIVVFDIRDLPNRDEDDSQEFGFVCCSDRFLTSHQRVRGQWHAIFLYISLSANFTQFCIVVF